MKTRVLVTGGAGFIGIHTLRRLAEDPDFSLLVIDDLRHACGEPLPGSVELVVNDVGRAAETVLRFKPDVVLHLAAQGGVSRSLKDPAADAQANVVATVALLKACVDAGCRRLVFASSGGAIYGHARRLPARETTRPQPVSPYGAAKLAAEAYLGMFARTFGLSTLALRYSNVYGPFQDGTGEAGVVAISCERLLGGRAPEIRGDGRQTRDFVYVADVAEANVLAVRSWAKGVVNIGTGIATSVLDVVDRLIAVAAYPGAASFGPAQPGEVRESILETSRAVRLLGWKARIPLHEGLEQTFRSFRERAPKAAPDATRGPVAGAGAPGRAAP